MRGKELSEIQLIGIEYKGKEYTLYPVCYIVSRDGTRKYLCGLRRNKLLPPMDLHSVKFLRYLEETDIDRKRYIEQIRRAWDIDVQQPCGVKVLVRKNLNDSSEVIEKIKNYLGQPVEENEQYNIYKGEVVGINDFKTWLRSYIEIRIVIEPNYLREEFMMALRDKSKRYEVMK